MNHPAAEPMNAAELTDRDGDALTITSDSAGIWITCTSNGEEVTVGPLPTGELRASLAAVNRPVSSTAAV